MKDGHVILHEDYGINSHLTLCQSCGETGDILLLGHRNLEIACGNCSLKIYGYTKKSLNHICPRCKSRDLTSREIGEYEKLECGLCAKCEKEASNVDSILKDGGVLFKCTECNREGVLCKCDFTETARESALKQGIIDDINAVFGVTFDNCTQHGEGETGQGETNE